jgi:hypothetical protein
MGKSPSSKILPEASTTPARAEASEAAPLPWVPATNPIVGLGVNVAGPCACGSRKTTITTERRMRCVQCGADRGGLGPRATKFIAEIAKKFGAPAEITIRRSLGDVESTDLIGSARSGRLTTNWRTRRRQFGR